MTSRGAGQPVAPPRRGSIARPLQMHSLLPRIPISEVSSKQLNHAWVTSRGWGFSSSPPPVPCFLALDVAIRTDYTNGTPVRKVRGDVIRKRFLRRKGGTM